MKRIAGIVAVFVAGQWAGGALALDLRSLTAEASGPAPRAASVAAPAAQREVAAMAAAPQPAAGASKGAPPAESVARIGPGAARVPPRAVAAELFERTVWSAVRDSFRAEDVERYLEKFPAGAYVDEATARLAYLRTPAARVDAAPAGAFIDSGSLPLVDAGRVHVFGGWRIYRRPSAVRARVQTVGEDKAPVLHSPLDGEDYYFYFGEGATPVAAVLHLAHGEASFVYQNRRTSVRLRSCSSRGRGSPIPGEDQLPFVVRAEEPLLLAAAEPYAVYVTTDAERPVSHQLRQEQANLLISLDGATLALAPDSPELRLTESDGDRCTFR